MSTETLSLLISGIIAILSLLVPLLQSLINRKTEERKLLIQHLYTDKLKAFEELMDSFGKYKRHSGNIDLFLSSLCKAMLFCDNSIRGRLQNIVELLTSEGNYLIACKEFQKLIPYFSNEIENSRNKFISQSNTNCNDCASKSDKAKQDTRNNS